MKLIRILAAFATALFVCEGAHAQAAQGTLSFTPASPLIADSIEAVVTMSAPVCPFVLPSYVSFSVDAILITMTRVADCGFGPYSQTRVSLGRLPRGSYRVVLMELFGGDQLLTLDTRTLVVGLPAGAGTTLQAGPLESYVGLWLTNIPGEGVFIDQRGATTFVTLVTYGADGGPVWLVMSDARWEYNATRGRFQYRGAVHTTRRSAPPPGAGAVAVNSVGEGIWYAAGSDSGALELTVNGVAVNRTLTRFRF